MLASHILLVDDDTLLRRSLAFNLEQAGYRVSTAASAEDALALAQRDPPDLVLLDIELPGLTGLDVLRHFQTQFDATVILLTVRSRELDEIVGLELGADDYVTKPFDVDVLLARIKAVLRRSHSLVNTPPSKQTPITVGDLTIDTASHLASVGGRRLDLAPREFDLLHTLALEAGHVVSANDLLARVWGAEFAGEPQVVYVHIRRLREKLEDDPQSPSRIITVRGVGYRLEPQEGA